MLTYRLTEFNKEAALPFLQSLFCFKGYDSSKRFLIIQTFTYLLSFVLTLAIDNTLAQLFILATGTLILTLSTKRRLHDANLTNYRFYLPVLAFSIIFLLHIVTASKTFWLIQLFVYLMNFSLFQKKPETLRQYILGYNGPVDMEIYENNVDKTVRKNRIEPTLFSNISVDNTTSALFNDSSEKIAESPKIIEAPKELNNSILFIQKNNKLISVVLSFLFIVTICFVYFSLDFSHNVQLQNEGELATQQSQTKSQQPTRMYKVDFNDNFSIQLTSDKALVLSWPGNNNEISTVWSLTSAKGDKTCQEIAFNNKQKYRPLTVTYENDNKFYATFSPLDTSDLIQNLAFKNKFVLCNFDFSLKGSQAVLGKSLIYREYLKY
jgi:hypothetical protein